MFDACFVLVTTAIDPRSCGNNRSTHLFVVGAVTIHLRAGDHSFALAVVFGLMAVATLVLRLPSA